MRLARCKTKDDIIQLLQERGLDGLLSLPDAKLEKPPEVDSDAKPLPKGLLPAYRYKNADIFYPKHEQSTILWLALDDLDEKNQPRILQGGFNEFRPCLALVKGEAQLELLMRENQPVIQGLIIQKGRDGGNSTGFLVPEEVHVNPTSRGVRQLDILQKLKRTRQKKIYRTSQRLSYVTTDLYPGLSLHQFIEQRKKSDNFLGTDHAEQVWSRLYHLFNSALKELDHLHKVGFVHMDATASNFIVDHEGDFTCRLIDFEMCNDLAQVIKPGSGKKGHFPPEVLDETGNINKKRKIRVFETYDYYMLACALGMVLVNEFRREKLESVESLAHQAMLGAMVASLVDKVIEPMSVEKPQDRQSISESVSQLERLDREFKAWFSAHKESMGNADNALTIKQKAYEVQEAVDDEHHPKEQIEKLKKMAISKLTSYRRWGLFFKLFVSRHKVRRYLSDAKYLIKQYEEMNDDSEQGIQNLLVEWRVLLLRGNTHRKKSAFRDGFNALLEEARAKFGKDLFSVDHLDNIIEQKRNMLSESCLTGANALFSGEKPVFNCELNPTREGAVKSNS